MGELGIKIKAPDPNGAIDNVFGSIEKKVDDRAKKSINNINNTLGKYENEVSNLINGIQIKNNKIQKIDLSDYLQLDASGLYKNAQKQTEIKRDVNKVIEYVVTETNKTFEKSVKSTGKISNDAFNELISNITVSDDEIDKLLKVSGNNNIDKAIAKKALQAQKLIEQLESSIGISWGKNGFDTTKIGTGLGFDLDAIENEINSLVSLGKTYTGLLGLVKNSNLKLSGYNTNKLSMRSNALQNSSEVGGKYWNEILTNMAKGALNPVSEFINSDHSDVGKTSQARDKLMSRFGSIFEESFKNMTRDAKEFDLELDTITEKLNTLSKSALSGNRNKWTTKAKEDFSGFLASYIAKGGNVDTDEFKTWSGIRDSLFNTKITPRNKTNIENYKAIYSGVIQYYEKQAQAAKDVVESEKQVQDAVGQSGEAVVNANNKKIKSQEEYRAEAEKLYKLRLEAYKDRETENLKFKEVDYSKYPEYDKGRQKTYFSEDGRYKAIKSYGQKAYDIFEKFGDTYGMYALTFSKTLKNAWQYINRSHNVESHILSDDKEHSINRIIEELIKNDEELAKEAERKKKLAEELREATQEEKDALLSEYPEAVVKKYQSNIEYARKVINSDLKFKRDKDDKRLYKTKDDLFKAYKNSDGTYSLLGYGDSYDSSTLSDLSRDILRIHQNIANDDLSIVKMKEHLDLLLDDYNEVKRLRAEGKNVDSPFDEFEKEAEEKRKAEEAARKEAEEAKQRAEEEKRIAEEEAARKAKIEAEKEARKARMEPLPDENIIKHSYGESGASTTVYSPHLGKTVTKNTTSEGDSFYGTQMNYQELEKRAIKLTNQLAVVNASIEIEESKSAASSQTRINNLNAQKDILERQLEYVRAIAQAEAENDDEVENPGYTMEQFETNVAEDTELFAAQLKTKTDKEIEAIQVSNERFDTKVQEYVARKRADLSKIDSIYKSDPAYKATENLINSFAPLDRDAFKKAELEINKSFNNLNQVIAKSRANLKGSNTLSTEKSAEFRLADAPKDIQDIINNYIKLGLTAEEAEGKVASLKETLSQINEKETNGGWTSAEDYSSTVGLFLNSIRGSKNELSSYKDQVTTIDKIQRKATSALEKYLKATKVIRAGKDEDATFGKQKKDAEKQFEQLLRIRRDYMSQAGIKDDGWEDEIRKLKESRESIIEEDVIDENKYKNEQKQIKITRERERLEERAYKALDQYLDLQKKVDLGQDTDGKFEEQARRRLELYEKLIKEREKLRYLESDEDPWLDHISKYREKREENIRKQVEEANKKSGLPSKADEKLRAKNERELAKAQSDAKKQSDQYGKNTANDLKQFLEKENTSIVSSFNSKKEQLKDALRKYYSDATGDPSILNELKKNVSNLFTEAFKILNNPSLTEDQTANLQESMFGDMSDIAGKKFSNLFSEYNSNIDKFEKQLLNLGYASDEVNEKISSLKVSLVGVKPGSNFINAFDPLKKWNDDFEKNKRDTINKMANTWLSENQTNRFENIKFLLGSDGALNGAIADINKLDEKLREGAISTAKYESEYEKLQKKWSNAIASFSYNPSENRDAMKQWVNMQAQGAAVTLKWSKDGQQLTGVFRNQNNELVKVVATADQFKGTVKGVVQEIKPMKSGIEAFFDSIGSKWQEVMRYMATYASLRSVWTEFQKGINVVREYDKALTEMNKVSDASMYTLQAFQKESFGIADSVGVTASVVQNSTADWLRLGESFAQAKESAKASAILYNVSEFQDIGSATDALVSASQAYQELSKTDIIDKINYIGNNYSIATDGLASALQRSAAVLKTQGNNLDQAIALITAGNSIIQNPEMVAAGIRTISLRIAGTEAAKNQLVEAGEDVDDFIIQTKSKTQQLIKNYTAVASNSYKGVDVLDDNGNLRSTYDILLDISKVYKEIQKTDKAAGTNRANALVEALAGKNRSNIAASILSAPEMLENVYRDSAFMSEGSANEELNKQLESIEGHVNRLKNTYDELWTSAVNRDVINFFIDMANGALTLVNNLGLVKTAFAGILSVVEFQSTMSGGGFLFGKTGLFTNLISGQKGQKENQFIDLEIGVLKAYNDAYDELDDKSEAYRRATVGANKVTKDFLHNQEGLVDIVNAQKLKDGKGDGFSAILENGKELAKGVAASVGTAIVTYAAEWAIGEIWKQVDQKVIHAHEYAVDRLNNAQSAVDTDNNEISAIDEQLKTIDAEIRNINSLGGASLAKEGELQKLEDQKKELEAQKELKQAILEMDMLELYSAAEKNAGTKVTGYEFARRSGSSYVEQQWIETEQSQQDAIRNTMKYYDYVVKQREQARSEYVRLEKEDAEGNKKRLSELKKQEEDWGKKAVEVRGKVAKMTADMDVTATTLSNWEKLGHTLDETQQDYINAAQEGKDFAIATKDLGIAATDASNSQRDFSHSCVQTSAQLTEQKASVDNLKTSYQEIFSLLSSFTGTDIVLDDAQLQKYAYALEYVNGVYTLNKEKLLDVAKANNAVEKSNLEEVRRAERMQLLDNIDEIETYNQKLQEGQKIYNGIDIQDYISQLQAENQQILSNCKVYDYQISQIDNMTSAYQRWLDTGNVSKDSKQFTDVQSSAKNLEELINTGYFNSEAASHEIDFIIPEDVSRDDKSAILKLAKEYNEYFADGIKGTNKFVQKAMKETLENGTPLIKQLEDGNYEFGEGVTVQDFMDKFGWSESAIRAMLQELHEAQGWNIDWSLENLDTLEDKVVHSQQVISDYESQIKELETTKSQRTLTDEENKKLDDLKDKLAEVKKEYAEMRDEFSKQLTSNIRDTIEENGGAQTISEGIPEDASDKEISDYLKGKTGVKSEYEVKVYTEDAQKNIDDLETKYKELEKLYNDPNTQLSYKSTLGKQMGEIEAEMDSEKLNLSLLSMLEFDSDGISTESTTQNILNLVGSIDSTLGRIANKVAPQPINGEGAPYTNPKNKPLSTHATVVEGTEYLPIHTSPNSIIDKKLLEGKIKLDTTDIDAARKEFEKLNAEQKKTTGVKSSTVTVNGIEYTLEKYRELYKLIQLVGSGRNYTGDTVKLGGRSARAKGNAFARGNDIVGEQGRELIVDPHKGIWYTVGDSGTEMIDLPKDAIVYSHNQTEALLKSGVTTRGKSKGRSFAEGNAYAEGPIGGGGGLETGSNVSNNGKNAAKSAADAAKSAEKAAKAAKDATDEAKNNMIWIDRAIERQERNVSKINDLVEDDYLSYTERLSDLSELREELSLQNEILTDALERRVEEFDKAFQELVEIFGEDMATDLLHKIEVGSVDKDTYKDEFGEDEAGEKKKKALDKVIDAYDEEVKLSDKLKDNEDAIRDAIQKEYEFRLNILEAEKDQLQFEMDTLEHNLDMKDVLGKMVVEGDYQDMIDQSEEIADNIQRTIDVLEEQLTTVDEGSAKYNEINSQLISAKKELQDIEKNQAEWNDKIMRLPIERIDRYINMLNNIKKDLENWSAEQNVLGIDTTAKTIEQRFDIAQRAIKKYNEQIDKYRDLLSHYEYGSDKFEETANSIQDCEDNVSSLIQEMRELNIQFLKLPIDDITKANEKLQNINAAEQKVLDDYDTALSAVLSKFDQLIDKRNDEIDILNKRYDEMIKPYQDQLDLLNEQNEAKQMQYNIDKAQYDLDKARQQKNVQVVRNGRIEYDSDIDALKSAQDNLNNAKHDKAVYDLQQQIDALEKERDSKIEPLEKEIDKLEDARNRWQTFEDERTFEKEAAEAVRLLGANWEKAIEGTITNPHSDDREYDIFSKNHIQLDRQITNNEKQIENNERMIDLMTRYVDAYMSGEMTYEEARSQYDKLYKDYQSGATLTSQESLAAELAFNRAKDMGDALRLNNAETKKSYDSFLGQLEKANEYNKTIDKYTKTWDEINESITKQLAELERLAALAVWSKNPTGYGAGTKYNPYGKGTLYEGDAVFTGKSLAIDSSGSDTSVHADSVTVISSRDADTSHKDSGPGSSSRSSGKSHYNHSSASGPASDPSLPHRENGLAGGIIGNIPPSEKFKKLQELGLKPLEPDEVPAFLHVGEGVVNAIQQSNILKSVGNAFKAGVASILPVW